MALRKTKPVDKTFKVPSLAEFEPGICRLANEAA